MDETIATNQGSWARAAARVMGVWFVFLFVSLMIWVGAAEGEFFWGHVLRTALFLAVSLLSAPAYGLWEYLGARRRDRRKSARGAKVAAIVALTINTVLLLMFLGMAEGLKHMR